MGFSAVQMAALLVPNGIQYLMVESHRFLQELPQSIRVLQLLYLQIPSPAVRLGAALDCRRIPTAKMVASSAAVPNQLILL